MKYYNEAMAKVISGNEKRAGIIPIKKVISSKDILQKDFKSSDKLTIFSNDMTIDKTVKLNYIGDKEYLKTNGYNVNDNILPPLCFSFITENGFKITDCSKYPYAESTVISEIGEDIHIKRRESYFAYATSFMLYSPGKYEIINSANTKKVYIDGTKLKMENSVLAELELGHRYIVTVFKIRGWEYVYWYLWAIPTIYTIVVLNDTIVGLTPDRYETDSDFYISTYNQGLVTNTSTAYNFPPGDGMPGELTNLVGGKTRTMVYWGNNMESYKQVYLKIGPVLNKVCGIISELKKEYE